ncbi:MAG TPA: protease inhibitor I42 family protein, partial [Candidatus Didemnitutus sp.]|nr:protease inhibitor I42 family protein [Candidatus Didemnitutus sp.]
APSGNTVSLGVEQTGGSYQVRAGDTILINLAANPSTGAIWEYTELNREIFSEEKTAKPKRGEAPLPGEGGRITFTLRAKKPGTSVVKMSYHRPWEPDKPWGTFEATITVTP